MRDDLISRKALVNSLETGKDKVYEGKTIFEVMNEIISEQETAFDKEKVIEELKANMNSVQGISGQAVTLMFSNGYYNGVKDAIEIVEKGGVE